MKLKNIIMAGVATVALGALSVPARADTIVTNQWYTGQFGSAIPSALLAGAFSTTGLGINGPVLPSGFANAIDSPGVNGSSGSWVITLAGPGSITVTDAEQSGDQFQIFSNGALIGTTSSTAVGDFSCKEDISCALGNAHYSSGTFALSAGSNTITGLYVGSIGNGDFNFVVQNGVPEPASMALLGAGMAGLGLLRRRKTSI